MAAWRLLRTLILSSLVTACGGPPSTPTSATPTPTSPTEPVLLTGCTSLRSGTYFAASDLCTGMSTLTILESNVTLDCRNHHILSNLYVTPGLSHVSIMNCVLVGEIDNLTDMSNFTISNSVLPKGMSFTNATGLRVDANTLSSTLRTASPAQVWVLGGTNVTITNNLIDGNYHGSDRSGAGGDAQANAVDDGIVLADVTSATVSGNTISHVFDAGIEGINSVQNAVITNNTVTAMVAGVSSYHCTAWSNNTIAGNTISGTNSGIIFVFSVDDGCAKDAAPLPTTGVFTNNIIDGNTVMNGFLLGINIMFDVTASVSGNIVRNNRFPGQGISLTPLAGFLNGGGNTCNTAGNFAC